VISEYTSGFRVLFFLSGYKSKLSFLGDGLEDVLTRGVVSPLSIYISSFFLLVVAFACRRPDILWCRVEPGVEAIGRGKAKGVIYDGIYLDYGSHIYLFNHINSRAECCQPD